MIRSFVPKRCLLIGLAAFIASLFSLSTISYGESPTKAPKNSSTKKSSKRIASKKPAKADSTPPPVVFDEKEVHTSFDVFTQEWMKKLAVAEEYHRTEKAQITKEAEGVRAEYIGYLPQRFIQVKQTKSTETPFVGILTYYERTLRCSGKTKVEALSRPCEQVNTTPVREIFRFTKGKWVY